MGTFFVTVLEVADQFSESRYVHRRRSSRYRVYLHRRSPKPTDGLGIEREEVRRFRIADNTVVEFPMGETRLRLEGREFTAPVIFAPDDATPLVGMTTLEILGLGVDPIEEKLVPVVALGR